MIYTTLDNILHHSPCGRHKEDVEQGYLKLKNGLIKKYRRMTEHRPFPITDIIKINGIKDAVWSLRSVDEFKSDYRILAARIAEMALPEYKKEYPNNITLEMILRGCWDRSINLINNNELSVLKEKAWESYSKVLKDGKQKSIQTVILLVIEAAFVSDHNHLCNVQDAAALYNVFCTVMNEKKDLKARTIRMIREFVNRKNNDYQWYIKKQLRGVQHER